MPNKRITALPILTTPLKTDVLPAVNAGVTKKMTLDTLSDFVSKQISVTGGTFNQTTGDAVFTNATGGTYTVGGFLTIDLIPNQPNITGGTFNQSTGDAIFTNSTGDTFSVSGFSTLSETLISDWRKNNYALSKSLGLTYTDENKQTITLPSGVGFLHNLLYLNGKIYTGTQTFPHKIIRFNNLDDLSDYSINNLSNDYFESLQDMVYSQTKKKLYTHSGVNAGFVILEVDPDTLVETIIYTLPFNTYGGQGFDSYATDDENLYLLYRHFTTGSCRIIKLNLTTYTVTGNVTLPSVANTHAIRYDGTHLYVTTAANPATIIKVNPNDLSIISSATFASGENIATDDMALVGDYVWVGLETLTGRVLRIKKSDLSITRVETGVLSKSYATFFDGKYVWVLYDSTPGTLVRINPETLEVYKHILDVGENLANEIVTDGQRLFITTYTNPAKLIRLSIPSLTYVSSQLPASTSVTGGTFNQSSGSLSFINTTGGTFSVSGLTNFIQVSKTQADALISSSTLTSGATYKITNVDSTLYGGTDVVLKATSTNTFSLDGQGIFYNPKYNQTLETYGIWNNISSWVTSSIVGTFNHNEVVTADNGAVGTLFSAIGGNKFTVTSGDFTTAISITGNTSLATANIASVVLRSYAINDTVIWGGKHWTNTTGLIGASTSSLLLDNNWTVIPYDASNYNVAIDYILYDYENDLIVRRQDKNGNIVEASKATVTAWPNPRTIALFQWGNPYVESTVKGCGNNHVINGYVDNLNLIGCFAHNVFNSKAYFIGNRTYLATFISNKLSGGSHISNNTLLSSGINNNNLEKGNVGNNNFNGSNIAANSLHTSYILSNDLQITSTINDNRLSGFSYIFNNKISENSTINANIGNNVAQIRANDVWYASQINSNNLTGPNTFIYINKMMSSSRINSNTIVNGYIVRNNMVGFAAISSNSITGLTGSNAATISTNNMISGDIQFNTLNGIRADIFGNNLIVPIGYTDTPGRAKIEYDSITTANGRIELCTLEGGGVIRNVNINANSLKLRKVDLYGQILDMNNVALTRDYEHNQLLSVTGRHTFKVTFDGNTGSGGIGFLNLPSYPVPTGYFIESVIVDVGTGLTGADIVGAVLNLGIGVDFPQSGMNDATGEATTLNAAVITKINASIFRKATANRNLVIEVRGAPITGGSATFTVNLTKLI